MDEHVGARCELARSCRVTDVAAELFDVALELWIVEGRDVERAHGVAVGEEPPREVEAEEPGPARDRPEHGAILAQNRLRHVRF
jgi:hypothetical protein